jgi:phage baseplate assembly protein W
MSESDQRGDEILGRGVAFPLRLSGGTIAMNAAEGQIDQSIRLILRTSLGERVMRPEFGGGLDTLAFEPMTAVATSLLRQRVQEALARFEPRIELLGVAVEALHARGELHAIIEYRVRRTGAVGNLVYPFYIERGEV